MKKKSMIKQFAVITITILFLAGCGEKENQLAVEELCCCYFKDSANDEHCVFETLASGVPLVY